MTLPQRAGDEPKMVELKPKQSYAWCACGKSKNQPFCDGSHQGSGITPKIFKTQDATKGYLCMCKQSKNAPYCDGSHKT